MASFRDIVEGFLKQDKSSLARAISLVERNPTLAHELITLLSEKTKRNLLDEATHIVGITGPPGVGKSTIISQMIQKINCGVILCDPSSLEGGAFLGDRIRMGGVRAKEKVFIRSIGTRGETGGISLNTGDIINLYTLFGMDRIIVETAGVGQTETEIHNVSDTVVLVVSPESGDEIQFMKSGIYEIADIIVLNKADRPQADKLYNEIKAAVELSKMVLTNMSKNHDWNIPIVKLVGKTGEGVDELLKHLDEHREYLRSKGLLLEKRKKRMERDLISAIVRELLSKIKSSRVYAESVRDMLEGKKDPYSTARKIVLKVTEHLQNLEGTIVNEGMKNEIP